MVTAPEYGGTIRPISNWKQQGIDPYFSGTAGLWIGLVNEKLGIADWAADRSVVGFDTLYLPIKAITGQLAESWETPDPLTYVFKIRDGSSWTFTKNDDYWGNDPKFPDNRLPYADQVEYAIVNDPAPILSLMRSGQADWIGFGMNSHLRQIGIDVEIQEISPAQNGEFGMNHTYLGMRSDVWGMAHPSVMGSLAMYWSQNGAGVWARAPPSAPVTRCRRWSGPAERHAPRNNRVGPVAPY